MHSGCTIKMHWGHSNIMDQRGSVDQRISGSKDQDMISELGDRTTSGQSTRREDYITYGIWSMMRRSHMRGHWGTRWLTQGWKEFQAWGSRHNHGWWYSTAYLGKISLQKWQLCPRLDNSLEIPGFEVDAIPREGHSPRADRESGWILGLALDWL